MISTDPELKLSTVQPLATFTSGQLINKRPVGGNGQIHNYCILFIISSVLTFVAFVWALFLMDEEKDRMRFELKFGKQKDNISKEAVPQMKTQESDGRHPLRLLFDLQNVKQIIITFIKSRPNYVRLQILLITGALFCNLFIILSPSSFLFQFVEKIYNWDAKTYSSVISFGQVVNTLVIICVSPLLIKVWYQFDI